MDAVIQYGPFVDAEVWTPTSRQGSDGSFTHNETREIIAPATPNRKRGKSMSFRSGQSGNVVRKGQMWHGRFYVDIPGVEARRRTSVPIGSIHSMKKTEAKRKLRGMLEKMGLNSDHHLVRATLGGKTFSTEAAWWRENVLSKFKPSCQEAMGSRWLTLLRSAVWSERLELRTINL